jgi:hypothetical protein
VDIADQFQKVRLLLTQDRFVAVLKQAPRSLVSPIEGHGVPCQHPSHDSGDGRLPRPEQEMVGHQAPGKTVRGCLCQNPAQPVDKIPSVLIVAETIIEQPTLCGGVYWPALRQTNSQEQPVV